MLRNALLLSIVSLFVLIGGMTQAQDNQLRDIVIFGEQRYGMWAGSGSSLNLEIDGNGNVPIDQDITYDDLPSLRLTVNGDCCDGWWGVVLSGENWETYDISPYVTNGFLTFNIRGDANIDNLIISLADYVATRTPTGIPTQIVNLADYLTISDDWQSVSIPIQDFLDDAGFNPFQMSGININNAGDAVGTLWLNNIRFTSKDPEPTLPLIKINQVGYLPDAPKYALVTAPNLELDDTSFTLVDASAGEVVYTGDLVLERDFDDASGDRVWSATFTDVTEEGIYRLQLPSGEESPVFRISANLYDGMLVDTMRYFYIQRQGIELSFETAGAFARGVGHPLDSIAEFRSGAFPARDVSGGWYDAGDYGKYINAGATAISDLVWAYRLFPEQFTDDQFNIAESGNGIPDILDEMRWELDWMLKMQDENTGGFWHSVGATESVPPDQATYQRYIEDTDGERVNVQPTADTASAVAVFAMSSTIFDDFDPAYAQELLQAAQYGWQYLEANPDGVAPVPLPYEDFNDEDERLWAAAALYRATGEQVYHDYYLANYAEFADMWQSTTDNAYGVMIMGMVAFLEYGLADNTDADAMAWFDEEYSRWRAMMLERAEQDVWGTTLLMEDYYWGSNGVALYTVLTLYVGDLIVGEDLSQSTTIAQTTVNYLLGVNPLRFSYVSGYGVDSVERPHSAMWSTDGIDPVPAGILAGGPNEYTNPLLYSSYPAKRYQDSDQNWSTNEHTIYWNSTLVFTLALIQNQ
ncbi:MAG: glycoside hydrolase family 9 protein [Chloroflexota bacterium]